MKNLFPSSKSRHTLFLVYGSQNDRLDLRINKFFTVLKAMHRSQRYLRIFNLFFTCFANFSRLFLDVGKVQQWMCTVKVGKFIQEYAAVYLTAGLENILEEVLTQCLFAYVIIELMAISLIDTQNPSAGQSFCFLILSSIQRFLQKF